MADPGILVSYRFLYIYLPGEKIINVYSTTVGPGAVSIVMTSASKGVFRSELFWVYYVPYDLQ